MSLLLTRNMTQLNIHRVAVGGTPALTILSSSPLAPARNSFPFFIMIPITMTEKLRRWLHAGKEKSPEAAQVCE